MLTVEVAKYFNEQSATFAFALNLDELTTWISLSLELFSWTWNPLERVALCEPHPPSPYLYPFGKFSVLDPPPLRISTLCGIAMGYFLETHNLPIFFPKDF